jgi:hypothetical protein
MEEKGMLADDLAHDLRYVARFLRRPSGFTIGAALTLTLGIGATAAVFTEEHRGAKLRFGAEGRS